MFKSKKKNEYSATELLSRDSIPKKTKKSKEEDSLLPTNSKKCKKKSFFHSLRKKINLVFENKSKEAVGYHHSSTKSLRSKSFEVLTSGFEDSESQGRVPAAEDVGNEGNKWGSRRSQSTRSKQTVCPTDYPVLLQTGVNSVQTWFQHGSSVNDRTKYNLTQKEKNESNSNCAVNIINKNLPSNSLESNCNLPSEDNTSSTVAEKCKVSEETFVPVVSQNSPDTSLSPLYNEQKHILSSAPQLRKMNKMNLKDLGLDSCPYFGMEDGESRSLIKEIRELSKYGWYWGPLNRGEAEEKLFEQPDGAFLVRDSSDVKYLLSLSFRSYGKTLHTRIEHSNGSFSFYPQPDHDSHRSLVGLINHCISESDGGVFCYSRPLIKGSPSFPVRLTKPVSRFMKVRSLQYLCRFVIRQYTSINHIQTLPLPHKIKGYLEESYY